MEFKYTEITMRLMLGFMHVMNSSPLVEPLWLACSIVQGGILFAKEPLGSGKSSFEVLPQCLHPVHLSVL